MSETVLLLLCIWAAVAGGVYMLVDYLFDRRNRELRRQNEQLAQAIRESDGDT